MKSFKSISYVQVEIAFAQAHSLLSLKNLQVQFSWDNRKNDKIVLRMLSQEILVFSKDYRSVQET